MSIGFFVRRQSSVVVRVEQSEDLVVGLTSGVVRKNPYVNPRRIFIPQTGGQLDFFVNCVVVPDESAHKSNYDDFRRA